MRFAGNFQRRATRANPRDVGFELAGAMRCRMIGEDALARCVAEPSSLCLAPAGQDLEHRGGAIGDHDLAARDEDGLKPGPFIGYDRRRGGGGLEQPHARAVAGPDHVGPRDVQREPARCVEAGVIGRGHMIDALDIYRPRDVVGIERAGDREFEMRCLP